MDGHRVREARVEVGVNKAHDYNGALDQKTLCVWMGEGQSAVS